MVRQEVAIASSASTANCYARPPDHALAPGAVVPRLRTRILSAITTPASPTAMTIEAEITRVRVDCFNFRFAASADGAF